MGHELVQRRAVGVAVEMDLRADGGEPERLGREITDSPYRRDVDIAFELEFELVELDASSHGIGVNPNGKARPEGGEQRLGRVGCGVVPEEARRFIDDVCREIPDVIEVPELAFEDSPTLHRAHRGRVGLALVGKRHEPGPVDRRDTPRRHRLRGTLVDRELRVTRPLIPRSEVHPHVVDAGLPERDQGIRRARALEAIEIDPGVWSDADFTTDLGDLLLWLEPGDRGALLHHPIPLDPHCTWDAALSWSEVLAVW